MPRHQTLPQKIANLIATYGIAAVRQCVDMAEQMLAERTPKPAREKPKAAAAAKAQNTSE